MPDSPAPGRELVRPAIATEIPLGEDLDALSRIANNLGKSGMFPDAKDGYQAFAKIMLGRSIGLGPMQAMTGIHVVEGKPQLAATTLAGFIRQHPDYDYRVLAHEDTRCAIEFGTGRAPERIPADELTDQAREPALTIDAEGREPGSPELEARVASERDAARKAQEWERPDLYWQPWPGSLGLSTFTVEEAKAAHLGKWPDKGKWERSQWGKWPKNMVFARAMSNGVKWFMPDLFGGVPVYTEGDEFTDRDLGLSDGTGDGEAEGINLGPEVEAVLARAESLGHAALANRAAVEVQLGGQDEAVVEEWITLASAQLDAMEPVEAEVVDSDEPADAPTLLAASAEALRHSAKCEKDGDEEGAKRWKEQADTLLQQALGIEEKGGITVETRKAEGGGDGE